MMAQNTIELVDLTKKYRSFTAVDHLNLTVRKGEILVCLAPMVPGNRQQSS
jgi:ABC-2 type transport system ATP-binding protein